MAKGYLYSRSYPVNDSISIVIPTVGQIIEDESAYYGLITAITATPADFMVQLDDIGVDFAKISPGFPSPCLCNPLKSFHGGQGNLEKNLCHRGNF